jgi:hypothetical protein
MFSFRPIAVAFLLILVLGSLCFGQDFSTYRGFQLGSTVEAVLKTVGMPRSDVRVVNVRPALIEELEWNTSRTGNRSEMAGSLRGIRFTFHSDELFKMVVTYDPRETEGLTAADVSEAISAQYGTMTVPENVSVVISADSSTFQDSQQVTALWQDPHYSYSLYRSTYGGAFGMVIISKEGAVKGHLAEKESLRLDQLEAPQREMARVKKEEAERKAAQETARAANKVKFRP